MNILIISPHPGFGGASTANQNIAKALLKAGHQVVYMDEYFPEEITGNANLHINYYPIHQNGLKKQIKTYKYLNNLKPDMIILGMPIIGVIILPILICFRLHGIKIGCIFHSLSLSDSIKGKTVDFLISCFSLICSHLFFVSNYTLKSWKKFWLIRGRKKNIFIMHNAVESNKIEKHESGDVNIKIGFVGRFSEEKQPHIFCEVAKSFRNRNIDFVAFGDGPLLNECKSKYAEYVDFHGYCNNQETIYNSIDILLLTSKFENCPMIILEAALRGVPSVAPEVGGIPEIVRKENNGELYGDYSTDCIKQKIELIINDYSSYSASAKNFVQAHTLEKMAEKWNNALK